MLSLDITLSQVIDLMTQLPPDGKRSVLLEPYFENHNRDIN